ncbi:MAG: dipeptidase PepE [Flavobacteriaceae bacterium]|nr:dipeptidase PepE [Flavobacteriaceae bacterium]
MKNIIIASTSTIYGSDYLEYLLPTLQLFFKGLDEILFIPYARPSGLSYDEYTTVAQKSFKKIGISIKGIHEFKNPKNALAQAKGVFVGGGNTFELVNQLYKKDLIKDLKKIVENGTPYLGTSAGSNICGPTMMTTNDMPIVYPPSFDTLNLIPYTINPHYLDADPNTTHKGETRETRIHEFHVYNKSTVIGLREGSWLVVKGKKIILKGKLTARVFRQNEDPIELAIDSILDY